MQVAWLLLAVSCSAFAGSDRPDLSGTWRSEGAAASSGGSLTVEIKGEELRIFSPTGDADATDVTCNTRGKECDAKVGGERVKVSYWYNGDALVEMLMQGKNNNRVVKTRRTVSADGQKMTVEVIPIVPAGKPEKHVLVRSAGESESAQHGGTSR